MTKLMTPSIRLAATVIFLSVVAARASEQMRSADSMETDSWAVSLSGTQGRHDELQFHVGGTDLVKIPLSNGSTAQVFSAADTDVKFDGNLRSTMLKLNWRPGTGLSYSLSLGTGDYELAIPSGPVTNRLRNETPGLILGVGVSWNLTPDTPVTPAVMLAIDYSRADYRMSRFQSGSMEPAAVRQDFSMQQMQVALSASKKWKKMDPYGGLRFFRQTACLYDGTTADRIYGSRDGYAPYAGCAFRIFEREELLVEVSGADETLITLGVNIGF